MTAQCQQLKELVTIDLCDEAAADRPTNSSAPSNKRVPAEGCNNLLCAAEKEKLREEIKALKKNLADYAGLLPHVVLNIIP